MGISIRLDGEVTASKGSRDGVRLANGATSGGLVIADVLSRELV